MSFKNLAWASEQSGIGPSSKLLAIFIASQGGTFGIVRFSAEDAAAWCGFRSPQTVDRLVHELANRCGLQIVRRDSDHEIMTFEVIVPSAKNGGELL